MCSICLLFFPIFYVILFYFRPPVHGTSVRADHYPHGMSSGAEAMTSGTEDAHG